MSRERWVEFHAETDHEHVDELLASWIDTAELLKSVVEMIECAQTRLIATGCLALERGVLDNGKQSVRFDGFQKADAGTGSCDETPPPIAIGSATDNGCGHTP